MEAVLSLIALDTGLLYLRLLQNSEELGLGYIPQLALTVLGNNMAQSFCERMISAANLIMHLGATCIGEQYLGRLCVLRMNREYMEFMKLYYPNLATHIMAEASAGAVRARHSTLPWSPAAGAAGRGI